MKKDFLLLAIESSCDDTGAAVLEGRKVRSNVVANQEVHRQYGGVVPELASRAHQANIIPVVDRALKKSGYKARELDAVAVTAGPGLMGSLLVGVSFAKSVSMALDIPLVKIHHMKAHVLAHLIEEEGIKIPKFPFLCLTVSGGHTQIVRADSPDKLAVLGETIDDAAGEAFDKTAKLLNLPYPGGPEIDRIAQTGNPQAFSFAKPKIPELNFSFSGLKTSILYTVQKEQKKDPDFVEKRLADLCASVQHCIVEILCEKLERAVVQTGITRVAIAGGVSANSGLRRELEKRSGKNNWSLHLLPLRYTTDNAAMIGIAGYYMARAGEQSGLNMSAEARMKM